jgi:hypothetical protein
MSAAGETSAIGERSLGDLSVKRRMLCVQVG